MSRFDRHRARKRDLLEQALENAPAAGPAAPGNLGLVTTFGPKQLAVCASCAARITVRGLGDHFAGWRNVFEPETFEGCQLRTCRSVE